MIIITSEGLPNRFAGQGTTVYNPRLKGKLKFPCFPNWPKDKLNIAEYVALFPNVMLGIHKDHYYAYWLEPVNHELTIEHMEIYYVGNAAANSKNLKILENKILNFGTEFKQKILVSLKECKKEEILPHIMVVVFLQLWIIQHIIFING